MYSTVIQVDELQALVLLSQTNPNLSIRIFDVSFDLMNSEWGFTQYQSAHIPGATYVDLDRELSDHSQGINTGRHPLPSREKFALWLGKQGIDEQTKVVVYDRNNLNYCVRLWWMLKWCGHQNVAVLNGGFAQWQRITGKIETLHVEKTSSPIKFTLKPPLVELLSIDEVTAHLNQDSRNIKNIVKLLDARSAVRYRGEQEPLDPVAGHIPGAFNRPFSENLLPNGLLKSKERLSSEFASLGLNNTHKIIHYCGSGVSATPNILAMSLIGMANHALYAGGWSEWCRTFSTNKV